MRAWTCVTLLFALACAAGCKDQKSLDALDDAKDDLDAVEEELDGLSEKLRASQKELAELKRRGADAKRKVTDGERDQKDLETRLASCEETKRGIRDRPTGGVIGVAMCDRYIDFMTACAKLMQPEMQKAMTEALEQMKKGWADAKSMGGSAVDEAIGSACKSALEASMQLPDCSSLPKPCLCDPKDPLCSC